MKHTILGAGGAIANALVPVLLENKEEVRQVSRSSTDLKADLTNYQQTLNAVQGSDIVYLLAGLPYNIDVWRSAWPVVMTNTLKACEATGAKLIFFDNVYMYGKVDGWMTEETPYNPVSKKGGVRATIARQLQKSDVKAIIARSADFYGPGASKTGVLNMLVIDRIKNGKKAQWLGNPNLPHSFTYIPDAAKALYLLSKTEDAFNQTWHLPTSNEQLSGRQLIELAGGGTNYSAMPKWMLSVGGLFNRTLKELIEMYYQNDSPYLFDSTKFNKAFRFTPTSYKEGINLSLGEALPAA